jgi:hypothetical protein
MRYTSEELEIDDIEGSNYDDSPTPVDFSDMIKSSANTDEVREKLDAYTASTPKILDRECDLTLSELGDVIEQNSHDMCQAFIVQLRQMRDELNLEINILTRQVQGLRSEVATLEQLMNRRLAAAVRLQE